MDIPLGIYTDIINYLEPTNILLLSKTCKQLYNIVFIDLVNIRILTNKIIGSENSGKYDLKDIPIEYFKKYNINRITKYIIDLMVDLEYINDEQWKPIHFICRHSTPEMIKYIVDKGVNLECKEIDGWSPIHIICRYSALKMIKYMINKGCNINRKIEKYNGLTKNYGCTDLISLNEILNDSEKTELIDLLKLN